LQLDVQMKSNRRLLSWVLKYRVTEIIEDGCSNTERHNTLQIDVKIQNKIKHMSI